MSGKKDKPVCFCYYVDYKEDVWDRVPSSVSLSHAATGEEVLEATAVKTVWDENNLYVRFDCVDTHTVSDYTQRNDPLYHQDVVEIYLDEENEGKRYSEIVVSPHNVVYDAWITHDDENDPNRFTVDLSGETKGLITSVETEGDRRSYTIIVPLSNFKHAPAHGTEWCVNFYRIDDDREGKRHFQAWSTLGAVNFHLTGEFGLMRFVRTTE